ncbi:MAG TPA: ATP-dependent DNA ligase, partial [Gemmatimonadales bacterium]|nr:ATP-dependent DNA ligase [Gemmatimonadales bacterium]
MRAFAQLYTELDETTATNEKVAALVRYFRSVPAADAAWAVHFLIGRRPKRLVRAGDLRTWAADAAAIPEWLFEESYHAVGDLAETIALLLPEQEEEAKDSASLSQWVEERLLPLRELEPAEQRRVMLDAWQELGGRERYVWNKLITGAFRVGASQRLVIRALAEVSGVADEVIAHRLMGAWNPDPAFFARLVAAETRDADRSRPYPFCLAYPLEQPPEVLGEIAAWQAEWKWDGIRAQLVRRGGSTWLWSRGEDLLTGRFPEVELASALLPDGTVI